MFLEFLFIGVCLAVLTTYLVISVLKHCSRDEYYMMALGLISLYFSVMLIGSYIYNLKNIF